MVRPRSRRLRSARRQVAPLQHTTTTIRLATHVERAALTIAVTRVPTVLGVGWGIRQGSVMVAVMGKETTTPKNVVGIVVTAATAHAWLP